MRATHRPVGDRGQAPLVGGGDRVVPSVVVVTSPTVDAPIVTTAPDWGKGSSQPLLATPGSTVIAFHAPQVRPGSCSDGIDVGPRGRTEAIHVVTGSGSAPNASGDGGATPCSASSSVGARTGVAKQRQRIRALLVDIGAEQRLERGQQALGLSRDGGIEFGNEPVAVEIGMIRPPRA